jgi:hypothetical protein
VSPKSRGRPPGRGRSKQPSRGGPVRQIYPADRAIADARRLVDEGSRLVAEGAASAWLGDAWRAADIQVRGPESMLILGVVGRVHDKPSLHGYAAIRALRLIAPANNVKVLDESIALLGEDFPDPGWVGTDPPVPVAAYIASDPWGSEQMLLVEYGGGEPHGLLAHVSYPGGTTVRRIGVLDVGSAQRWTELTEGDAVPMPIAERPVEEVLAKLAEGLRLTDLFWPKHDDPDYVDLRALASARCAAAGVTDQDAPDWEPISDVARAALLDDFARDSGLPDSDANRIVADCCVDYGDGYIAGGVLAWSPGEVELFLTDWLPRKVLLDREQRAAVPAVTREWVQFALARAGVERRWIDPVVAAVDEHAEGFAASYDDESAWGPGKQIVADMVARGVDVTDKDQMEIAIREYNAEQLARRALEE